MDLASTGPRPRPPEAYASETPLACPKGTASAVSDHALGTVDIYADIEVDPDDWEVICDQLDQLGVAVLGEPDYLKGVHAWHLDFKTSLSLLPQQRPAGPAGRFVFAPIIVIC